MAQEVHMGKSQVDETNNGSLQGSEDVGMHAYESENEDDRMDVDETDPKDEPMNVDGGM